MHQIDIDNKRFKEIVSFVVSKEKERNIIGKLSEKILHSTLKYYFAEEMYHEIKVNSYYADIKMDNEIYEIQNGNFNKLREKLNYYINEKLDVTIIYPIICKKTIYYLDEYGELSTGRVSSKKGSFFKAFPELYKIKNYLNNNNLHFMFVLINADEYKMLAGYDKRNRKITNRIEMVPKTIENILVINDVNDYKYFTKDFEDKTFKTKDYQQKYKTNVKEASLALNILCYLDVIKRVGKEHNAYLYQNIK